MKYILRGANWGEWNVEADSRTEAALMLKMGSEELSGSSTEKIAEALEEVIE